MNVVAKKEHGPVTATEHRKLSTEELEEMRADEEAKEFEDEDASQAETELLKLKRQNSLVVRVEKRVLRMLEQALES